MQYTEIQNLDSLIKHPAGVFARGRMHPAEPPGTPRRNPVRPQQTHAQARLPMQLLCQNVRFSDKIAPEERFFC